MTVPAVEDFVEELINDAISKRRANTKHRGRKQPLFITCEIVVDNAIMPSCSLRKMTRSSNQVTAAGGSILMRDIDNDHPVVLPSRPSTESSTSHKKQKDDGRTTGRLSDHRDAVSSPRTITSPWDEYSSLSCPVDRSPQSVLTPPGSANIFPPVSPRSARWTSTATPPRTFLKTKSGLKRLDSDSPLACPQRMLLSPGGESSSS